MKKSFLLKLICLLITLTALFSFASCGNKEIKEYTITMSDEAKAKRDALLAAGGNYYFLEENFQPFWDSVINKVPQPVPDIETKNTKEVYQFMDQDIYTLSNGDYDNIVLYIHGGAWVYEITYAHITFCDDLVDTLNAKVYIPIYDLAPNATYVETVAFVKAIYNDLLTQNKPVYVMGDSAGGTISLDLIYALKEAEIKMPDRLVLLAPCSDITFTNPDMKELEKSDPNLGIYGCAEFAELWAGSEENLTNPAANPKYADVTGYPKTMLIQGTNDILSADNFILCDKLNEAGVDVTLVKGEGLFHVFSVYDIPEKEESLKLIKDFCK